MDNLETLVKNEVEKMGKEMYKKVMVTSDYHIPFEDKKAVNVMLKYAKQYKPDVFVINGDFVDFYRVSKYDKNPDRKETIQQELDLAQSYLKQIDKTLPKKTQKYFLLGNHECVKYDTEILTKQGWKRADEIHYGDKIAQFNIKTGKIIFDYPIKISHQVASRWVKVKTWLGEEHVTLNHNLIVNNKRQKVSDLIKKGFSQVQQRFAGEIEEYTELPLTEDEIRLLIWVIMDGTIVDYKRYNKNSNKVRIQFKLSKERKINNLIELLERMNIPYTIKKATKSGINKLQPFVIRIYGDWARWINNQLKGEKEIPEDWVLQISEEQLKVILETIEVTDGYWRYNQLTWTSVNFNNIDRVQRMCILHNIPFKYTINKYKSGFFSNKIQYKATIFPNGIQSKYAEFEIINEATKVVAITTKEKTLITRVNGKVNFTGNSRVQIHLWRNPELYGLEVLKIENLLNLKENGFKFIGGSYDYWKQDNGHLKLGDVIIMHGDNRLNGASTSKYAGYSAKNTMYTLQHSVIMGHTHRLAIVNHTSPYGKLIGIETGCLSQQTGTANWQQGFVTFELYKGKMINPRLHYILDGKIYEDGKVYR